MSARRIERRGAGRYRVKLPREERDILRALPDQLRALLGTDDASLQRLFPTAYEDEAADDEYGLLVRGTLLDEKLAALGVLERTVDADELDGEQLAAWLGALESLRLVLGTQLDVTEETYVADLSPDDPQAPALALYGYLSWLQEETVEALSAELG